MNSRKLLLTFLLCLFSLSSYSQSSSFPKSFIKSIEHGVYIDHHFVFPYTHLNLTTTSNISFEVGMIDLPEQINFRFNNVIQQQSGDLSYLIPNMEEFAEYKGRPRKKEFTFSVGKVIQKNKFRYILQAGTSTTETYVFKFSHYYRVIAADGGFMDLGLHYQLGEKRRFIFFGYSWGIF